MMPSSYVPSDFVTRALSEHRDKQKIKLRRGKKLSHVPFEMRDTCQDFLHSIAEKNSRMIMVRKVNSSTGEKKDKLIPYIHRHCSSYLNITRAKFHYAQEYFGDNCKFFFVTLTVAHGNVDYEECLDRIKDSKKRFARKMRDWGYRTSMWILDVHETGYTHCHCLVRGEISSDRIHSLKLWWSFKLNMGSYAHGLDVRIPNTSSSVSASYEPGVVKSVVGYFMKYLVKHLTSEFEEPKFLVFNAVLWKTRSRLFGFSRDVSKFIKEKMNQYKESVYGKKGSSDWVFDGSAICDLEGNVLSEIPKKRSPPKIRFKDIFIRSVSKKLYELFGVSGIDHTVEHPIIKYVGDRVELYNRVDMTSW